MKTFNDILQEFDAITPSYEEIATFLKQACKESAKAVMPKDITTKEEVAEWHDKNWTGCCGEEISGWNDNCGKQQELYNKFFNL